MKIPNLSLPIDSKLHRAIRSDARRTGLSRADVVRQILKKHYGLLIAERQEVA